MRHHLCRDCRADLPSRFAGLFTVNPNEGRVLTLFGKYVGTVREAGLWFANPFYAKKRISNRVRNFETTKLKVNDNHGNPIEIAAVVVWKVVDSAEALFEVDDYQHYVHTQSESAVRTLAQTFPYDAHATDEIALSTHPQEVAKGSAERDRGTPGEGGGAGDRGADQPPRVRTRNRLGHAAAPAGERDHRRPEKDRRGRGGDGGKRARTDLGEVDRQAR